ncbi:MAG: hypothetical protein ACKV19_03675 [Verrucomicrobiales bacterium]
MRVDGPETPAGYNFFAAALSTRAATTFGGEPSSASVGEITISSDGHAYAHSGNENVPTFIATMPVTLGEWHHLAIVADFANKVSSFFVDDVLLATLPFEPTEEFTGVLLRGTLLATAAPDTITEHKADYSSRYDQFSIRVTGK